MAGSPADPQSLDRYAYISGNPLGGVDPFGTCNWDTVSMTCKADVAPTRAGPDGRALAAAAAAKVAAMPRPVNPCLASNFHAAGCSGGAVWKADTKNSATCAKTGGHAGCGTMVSTASKELIQANEQIRLSVRAAVEAQKVVDRNTQEAADRAREQALAALHEAMLKPSGGFDIGGVVGIAASFGAGMAVGMVDASGISAGIIAVGAVAGGVSALAGDVASGHGIDIEHIAAGAVAGGTYAAVFEHTGSAVLAGAASGAAADVVTQGWDYVATGGQTGFDVGEVAMAAGTGAVAGWAGNKIAGKLSSKSEAAGARADEGVGPTARDLPSPGSESKLSPGPHADKSIAARGPDRSFTPAERSEINDIGSRSGCHSCGTPTPGTKTGNWVLDHQPVSALNEAGAPQRLYPQCLHCSQVQGGQTRFKLFGWPT